MNLPHVIVVMGVAGSGKTTIGSLLSKRHGGRFFDADEFHPQSNRDKMTRGIALTDEDRLPWLTRLRTEVIENSSLDTLTILACSALKKHHREILSHTQIPIFYIYLTGSPALLGERISSREGHFMQPGMLASQLESLEPPSPTEALHIPISLTPSEIISLIDLSLFSGPPP